MAAGVFMNFQPKFEKWRAEWNKDVYLEFVRTAAFETDFKKH